MVAFVPLTLLLAWVVFCFAVSVWCTGQTGLTVWKVLIQPPEYERSSVTSKGMNYTLRWIMVCTFISSLCFTMVLCIWMPTRIVYTLCLGWPNHTNPNRCSKKHTHRIDISNYSGLLFMLLGYLSLLRMVFGTDTTFGWSKRTIWIVRGITAMGMLCVVLDIPVIILFGTNIGLTLLLPVLIIYPFLSGWIAMKYLKSTRMLADSIDSSDLSRDLLNVAVRLSIVSSVAILTTIFSIAFSFLSTPFPILTMIRQSFWIGDMMINNYGLLCFFKAMEGYYQWTFGSIHRFWLDRLL